MQMIIALAGLISMGCAASAPIITATPEPTPTFAPTARPTRIVASGGPTYTPRPPVTSGPTHTPLPTAATGSVALCAAGSSLSAEGP